MWMSVENMVVLDRPRRVDSLNLAIRNDVKSVPLEMVLEAVANSYNRVRKQEAWFRKQEAWSMPLEVADFYN